MLTVPSKVPWLFNGIKIFAKFFHISSEAKMTSQRKINRDLDKKSHNCKTPNK